MTLLGCEITVVIVESCPRCCTEVRLFMIDSILLTVTTAHNVVNFKAYLLSKSSHVFFTLKVQNPGSLWKGYALIGFFCTCCYFIPEKMCTLNRK